MTPILIVLELCAKTPFGIAEVKPTAAAPARTVLLDIEPSYFMGIQSVALPSANFVQKNRSPSRSQHDAFMAGPRRRFMSRLLNEREARLATVGCAGHSRGILRHLNGDLLLRHVSLLLDAASKYEGRFRGSRQRIHLGHVS